MAPPQQRNHRGKPVGKVNCKNMKQDCPVPACPRATLLPGHCCHTCPKGEESGCVPAGSPHSPPASPTGLGKGALHTPLRRVSQFVMKVTSAHDMMGRGKPSWEQPERSAEKAYRAKCPACPCACAQHAPAKSPIVIHRAHLGLSREGGIYNCPHPELLGASSLV